MLPSNPLPQLNIPRIKQAVERIREQIWCPMAGEINITRTTPNKQLRAVKEVKAGEFHPIPQMPFQWGKLFEQCWFKVELPTAEDEQTRYLVWGDEAECTVYHQGTPWYGLDPAHKQCPLPNGAHELLIESVCCQTGIWLPGATGISKGGSLFKGAHLVTRNEEAWTCYHDIVVLLDLLHEEFRAAYPRVAEGRSEGYRQPLEVISPLFRRILSRLDAIVDVLDQQGIAATLPLLKKIYAEFPTAPHSLKAILTGHAHIDLVWLWPERIGEFKAVHTFASMNRLMDSYPEFRFGYTQPASYDAVSRRSPELIEAVKKRLKEGKWEATGATEVESDTQLACGENLARSFILGQEGFHNLRGEFAKVLWIPDVFGYSPCLPQLMKASGVENFFTTKLTWSTVNRFPYSSFRWIGHDGSEVLVHVTQAYGYNGAMNQQELRLGANNYRQADVHDEFLAPIGYGDGGGGTTEEMLERARRMRNLTGLPESEWDLIENFFDRLSAVRPQLPAYQGELFLEYHRGVQTTHGKIKGAFRRLERSLQYWESVRSATSGKAIPQHPWKRLVFAQFHDYIPGSSIMEVYEEADLELNQLGTDALKSAASELGNEITATALFNPLGVAVPFVNEDGSKVALLEAHCGKPISSILFTAPDQPVQVTSQSLGNNRMQVLFDAMGRITSMCVDGVELALDGPANDFAVYPDHPHAYPAWDIDRQTLANGTIVESAAQITIEENTPARATLSIKRALTAQSSVVTRYTLEADSCVLKISYSIDWNDRNMLLKAIFPTTYRGRSARFGTPFGSTLRTVQPGDPRDEAMWEVPASRWAAVCDDTEQEGLMVLTEAKYGFSCQSGQLGLSLVRSALYPKAKDNAEIRDMEGKPIHSDIGVHEIKIAVGRYTQSAPREELPATLADTLFTQPLSYEGDAIEGIIQGLAGDPSLHIAWIKPAGNGRVVVRLNETMGRRGKCRILTRKSARFQSVDLLERPLDYPVSANGEISFTPYALLSVLIDTNMNE